MVHRFAGTLRRGGTIALAFAFLAARPDAAVAQRAPELPRYQVTGFRDARFGMTEDEVRAAARNSFDATDGDMTLRTNPVDGTTTLIVHVRMLEPGLGEGRVEYVFGYKSHALVQVNVIWGLDTNPPRNNSAMIAGSARIQRYFLGFAWANKSVRAGVPIDEASVLLFSAEDGRNGAVSVVIEGVRYDVGPNGVVRFYPERMYPPRLMVSYMSDNGITDVRNVGRGDF
jgi:hypothetical protein